MRFATFPAIVEDIETVRSVDGTSAPGGGDDGPTVGGLGAGDGGALVLGMAMVSVVLAEAAVKMEKVAAAARGSQTLRPQRAQDSVRLLSAEWSNIVQHHRPQHMRWCKARHRCQR